MSSSFIKRKVFISHYKEDRKEVDAFIDNFSSNFIQKALGVNDNDDFINSADTVYVMQRIREIYLADSTVTIVLIGSCTHSRRYVDWEIKSSLQQGQHTPNGLIGILLPSHGDRAHLPPRLEANLNTSEKDGYARYKAYPQSKEELSHWIEDAFQARTLRKSLIQNPQSMMKYNHKCEICKITH